MNACHGSDSPTSAAREVEFFFPSTGPGRQNTAKFNECTCCVIKPHAVKAGMYNFYQSYSVCFSSCDTVYRDLQD